MKKIIQSSQCFWKKIPCCREFTSLIDSRDEYVKFCPETFKYGYVTGTEEVQTAYVRENQATLGNKVLLEMIGQFSSDMEDSDDDRASTVVSIVYDISTGGSWNENKITDIITTISTTFKFSFCATVRSTIDMNIN